MPFRIFSRSKSKPRVREFDTFKDRWWENSATQIDPSVLEQLLEVEKPDISETSERALEKHYQSQRARETPRHADKEPLQRQYPCEQCGAVQSYAPGTDHLLCEYCGFESLIEESGLKIREYDFNSALHQLQRNHPVYEQPVTKCQSCAAEFAFDEHIHADECPFCGSHIVQTTGHANNFRPQSLLPFAVTREQAQNSFEQWVGSLWFAPSNIRHALNENDKLVGVYLPYWTYDSDTETDYAGERGEHYQEQQVYYTVIDGRRVQQTRYVTKTRWFPAYGRVARYFDDILIGATRSLPRKITDNLQPWDLPNLVPYKSDYLSGFRSEVYQVALDEGFDIARKVMDNIIRRDICRDIGGDVQRIHNKRTLHFERTYKHILLPVWSAAFRHGNTTYRFVVNARTGKVRGERPYSKWKIFGTFITLALILVIAILLGNGEIIQIR